MGDAVLVLEDGSVHRGEAFGARGRSLGEGFLCWVHVKKLAAIEADKAAVNGQKA